MNKVRSFYIELLRILAAFHVFMYHVGSIKIKDQSYFVSESFNRFFGLEYLTAHYFVIVFFVLSGLLITTSANRPNLRLKDFFIMRLGRLYSVVIPALVFSFLVAIGFTLINSAASSYFVDNDSFFVKFILNITFLTQSWTLCSTPPLNTPFWSVSYEFVYYILIGCFVLLKNRVVKIAILSLVIVAQTKIILLFPTFLMGSMIYYLTRKKTKGNNFFWILFFLSSLAATFIIINPKALPFVKDESDSVFLGMHLFFSWNYQADYLFAAIVALNVYSLFEISQSILNKVKGKFFDRVYSLIRTVGNCTFTLYLFHLPLLFLFSIILPYDRTSIIYQVGLIIVVLISVYFIARQTEWKVDVWRSLIGKIFSSGYGKVKSLKTRFYTS